MMAPEFGASEPVDWRWLEAGWGVTGFPSDYMEFMSRYGAGEIEESLYIVPPNIPGDPGGGGMFYNTEIANGLVGSESFSVLAWGVTVVGDILCWKVGHSDPDQWPVIVWQRDDFTSPWLEFDCGLSGFLVGMFLREYATCPIGDSTVWGCPAPKFLSNAYIRRCEEEGVDPWTGEPDPYAGRSFDEYS
ncbi:hypothetical protein AB0F07_22545 [Streptomyces fructofermentans]|uniref:hypothetical protein n=1 Tax=Streptomyces fructofermentans TaxID=152141 RepID=UPI0033CFE9CD